MTSIYVVESTIGTIKIGCSAKPTARAETIAVHSPTPVRLIAVWPGTPDDEKRLHELFSKYRSHREWFDVKGELAEWVASIRGKGVDCLPAWDDLKFEKNGRSVAAQLRSASHRRNWADPEWRAARMADINRRKQWRQRRKREAHGALQ